MFLVNEFEFNTNTYTSNNRQEFEMYYSRVHGKSSPTVLSWHKLSIWIYPQSAPNCQSSSNFPPRKCIYLQFQPCSSSNFQTVCLKWGSPTTYETWENWKTWATNCGRRWARNLFFSEVIFKCPPKTPSKASIKITLRGYLYLGLIFASQCYFQQKKSLKWCLRQVLPPREVHRPDKRFRGGTDRVTNVPHYLIIPPPVKHRLSLAMLLQKDACMVVERSVYTIPLYQRGQNYYKKLFSNMFFRIN